MLTPCLETEQAYLPLEPRCGKTSLCFGKEEEPSPEMHGQVMASPTIPWYLRQQHTALTLWPENPGFVLRKLRPSQVYPEALETTS